MSPAFAPLRPALVTIQTAASLLSVDEDAVYELIRNRDLKAVRLDGQALIRTRSLAELVNTLDDTL